jgi:hypothetical protein
MTYLVRADPAAREAPAREHTLTNHFTPRNGWSEQSPEVRSASGPCPRSAKRKLPARPEGARERDAIEASQGVRKIMRETGPRAKAWGASAVFSSWRKGAKRLEQAWGKKWCTGKESNLRPLDS